MRKRIILVDDDKDELFLFEQGVLQSGVDIQLVTANGGQDLLDKLQGENSSANLGDNPDDFYKEVILIDLNMPIIDGFKLMQLLKQQHLCIATPKIVYSTSEQEHDVIRSYRAGACGFISKPDTIGQIEELVHALNDYWFSFVTLPKLPLSKEAS